MEANLNMGNHNIENVNNISNPLGGSLDLTTDCMLESSSGAVIINSNLPVSIPNSDLDMGGNSVIDIDQVVG